VYALGAPKGHEGSISGGLISQRAERNGVHVVQTSAAISPGSSGGPLFDARGNLIGITSFQRTDAQNINFAIAAEEWWK
jgi:S1-C subfamily serine protease